MNAKTVLAILGLLSFTTLLFAPLVGMEPIAFSAFFHSSPGDLAANILKEIRLPRVLASFLAGAALAVSGMAFQAMFRNPLAEPFTLGVASGAAFGASIYIHFGFAFTLFGLSGLSLASFLGALASILLVYGLTKLRGGFSAETMLLAGVAMSFFFSSAVFFTQYLSDLARSFRILRWLMGGFEVLGFETIADLLPFVLSGGAVILFLTHELNLLLSGEEEAISRGVDVRTVKRLLFFATSLMVGGVVAVSGPIGFVGMMSPHICRLLVGPDHRTLTPATILFGGTFLCWCDTLARTLIAPVEIPVGIITAMLGGPFFIFLLLQRSSPRRLLD